MVSLSNEVTIQHQQEEVSKQRQEGGGRWKWWCNQRDLVTLETAACLFFRNLTCSLQHSWNGYKNWIENIRDIDKGSKCGQLFSNKVT